MELKNQKRTDVRYVKVEDWYVELTRVENGFIGKYYEQGKERLNLYVSAEYDIYQHKIIIQKNEVIKGKKKEIIRKVVEKIQLWLKVLQQTEELEKRNNEYLCKAINEKN